MPAETTVEITDDPGSWARTCEALSGRIRKTPTIDVADAGAKIEVIAVLTDIKDWANGRPEVQIRPEA